MFIHIPLVFRDRVVGQTILSSAQTRCRRVSRLDETDLNTLRLFAGYPSRTPTIRRQTSTWIRKRCGVRRNNRQTTLTATKVVPLARRSKEMPQGYQLARSSWRTT
jgi:hypothetical protein